MAQSKAKVGNTDDTATTDVYEAEVAYLAKRHRVSPAIVREIIRRTGSSERGAIEREIEKGKARR
jgi:Mor family transcriptional regulator